MKRVREQKIFIKVEKNFFAKCCIKGAGFTAVSVLLKWASFSL